MATAVLSVYGGDKVKVGVRVTESNGNIIVSAVDENGREFGSGSKLFQLSTEDGQLVAHMFNNVATSVPMKRSPKGNGALLLKTHRVNQPLVGR